MVPGAKPVPQNVTGLKVESRLYVSVVVTGLTDFGVMANDFMDQVWDDPRRGTVPVGFALNPYASRLVPHLLAHCYAGASPSEVFVAHNGVTTGSIAGYERGAADWLLGVTRATMAGGSISVILLDPCEDQTLAQIVRGTQPAGVLRTMAPEAGLRLPRKSGSTVIVATVSPSGETPLRAVTALLAQVREETTVRPLFLTVTVDFAALAAAGEADGLFAGLVGIQEHMGDTVQFVRPDVLVWLAGKHADAVVIWGTRGALVWGSWGLAAVAFVLVLADWARVPDVEVEPGLWRRVVEEYE
jgi:hypothetical protein